MQGQGRLEQERGRLEQGQELGRLEPRDEGPLREQHGLHGGQERDG